MAFDAETDEELDLLRDDFAYYASQTLKIKGKSGGVEQFTLNRAQQYIHERIEDQRKRTGKVRVLILKGRQQGVSTYVEGRFYWKASGEFGMAVKILTHLAEATTNLFAMTRRYHDLSPDWIRPQTRLNSTTSLEFNDLGSEFSVATAGSAGTGRSATAQYFHGCLSPDSWIVTPTGRLARMREMKVGDKVLTHTGEVAPISFVSMRQKPAMSVKLKGIGDPVVATGEHRFWTKAGWSNLESIAVGDVIGYPVRAIKDEGWSWPFRLPKSVRPQGGGTDETGPEWITPSYEIGRVLGLYLAEGCIVKQVGGTPSGVTFAVHERETARTEAWLDAISGLYRSHRTAPRVDSKTVTVTAYGRSFATWVRNKCGELDDKRLPAQWWRLGDEFVRGLVHGYLAGDGHSSKREGDRRISAPSIRSAITIGMRDALASLGYGWACVSYREAAVRNDRDEKAQWTLRLCGQGVDRLCTELGWQMPERKRSGDYGDVQVADGYAWVPITAKDDVGLIDVMDFEIDHEDHSYLALQGATHNSEVAFWPNAGDQMMGIGQIVPNQAGTEIILESTANGVGNFFHTAVMRALAREGEYELIFVPWTWQPEYAIEPPADWRPSFEDEGYGDLHRCNPAQLYWRHLKINDEFEGNESRFDQEYPATIPLAFRRVEGDTFIPIEWVERAQQALLAPPIGVKILGIDPAEYGDDSTVFLGRQGRNGRVYYKRFKHIGQMEIAGKAARVIDEFGFDVVNIDTTGGYGGGVADRLIELGYNVNRINFGATAIADDKYPRRADEMWGDMKAWLAEPPVCLPVDPLLQVELTMRQYGYDSSRRTVLESKEKMKNRGLKSPDGGDALALTFAMPARQKKAPPRVHAFNAGTIGY